MLSRSLAVFPGSRVIIETVRVASTSRRMYCANTPTMTALSSARPIVMIFVAIFLVYLICASELKKNRTPTTHVERTTPAAQISSLLGRASRQRDRATQRRGQAILVVPKGTHTLAPTQTPECPPPSRSAWEGSVLEAEEMLYHVDADERHNLVCRN